MFSKCHHVEAQTSYELLNLGYRMEWDWMCPECRCECPVYPKQIREKQ